MTRQDGRAYDELRPIKITTDFVKFPEGSCLIECGDTKVLCCASIEEKTPPHVAEGEGWVTAEYSMLPRANRERSKRDISKLKLSPRSAEIQRLVGRSLRAAVDMKALGERTINIDCDVLQGDGGTRTASVTGGFVALALACRDMAAAGTAHVGDYAGDGLLAVDAAVRAEGMGVTHFCEWFGGQAPFIDDGRPWPPRCRALLERRPEVAVRCAPAGHALYSTDARVLQDARQWCRLKGRPFALHLAESEDETRLLLDGEGPLWDCYRGMVLPEDWAVPHLRPVAYARRLDLLGPGTLAVHGVQLEPAEVTALAASGSALCLCPRSNEYLAVGTAPVAALLESGLLCCLGTDGLSSNTDLDVRQEAVFLRERLDVAPQALIRCLTVNGAAALGLAGYGRLEPGSRAVFSVLPESLSI